MNLDIEGLMAFVKIYELGSFSQAAGELFISQPALSRRLKKLETRIGVRLIDRTTQKMSLTAVGRDFYPQAQRLLRELAEAAERLQDISKWQAGSVTIASIPTAAYEYLPRVIKAYGQRYPENRIRIMDIAAQDVVRAVLRGDAEFGLSFLGAQNIEVDFQPLFDDPFVVVCRRDHPLAQKRSVTWRELSPYRLVHMSANSSTSILLDLALNKVSAQLRWFHEVDHQFSSGLGLVEADLGIMILPNLAFAQNRYVELVSRPLKGPVIDRSIGILRRAGAALSPAAERLLETFITINTTTVARPMRRGPAGVRPAAREQ
jgi:DNA-binding transcriptional LysR family regulator